MRRTASCGTARAIRAAILALVAAVGVYVVVMCSGTLLMRSLHARHLALRHQLTVTGQDGTLDVSAIDSATRKGNSTLEIGWEGGVGEGEMDIEWRALPPLPQLSNSDRGAAMAKVTSLTVSGVPRVVHVLWAHPVGTTFLFQQALSLLSIRRFVAPQRLCVWYTADKPTGAWWHFARLALPYLVTASLHDDSDIHISSSVVNSDVDVETVTALRILLKYGGIFISLNTAVVRPIDSLLAYHVTVGLGNVLPGFVMSTAHSVVLRQWLAELDKYSNDSHLLSTPRATARSILKRYSNSVHYEPVDYLEDPGLNQLAFDVEPVIYDDLNTDWLLNDQSPRHNVVDMTERQPCRHYDPNSILSLNTTRGRVFRYIYYGSQEYTVY